MWIQADPQFCKGTSTGVKDWLNFCRDNETGIESISTHFHGHAAEDEGFTYSMLYLLQVWVSYMMARQGQGDVSALEAVFRHTLTDDPLLISAIQQAFMAVHHGEGRLAVNDGSKVIHGFTQD